MVYARSFCTPTASTRLSAARSRRLASLVWTLLAFAVLLPSKAWAQTASKASNTARDQQRFESFSELRNTVLDLVSGAKQRIWVVTPYLTDGEIVSALYVAQYRKLDVKVLLGRAKANHYMSRLAYLKNQNIPVFLKPDSFKPKQESGLLIDERLIWIDGELDFLAKYRRFHLTQAPTTEFAAFLQQYATAAKLKVPAHAAPVPLVGRAGHNKSGSALPRSQPAYNPYDGSGAYTYGGARPKPVDVPTKLPKTTIWQQRAADRAAPEAAKQPQLAPEPADPMLDQTPPPPSLEQETIGTGMP